MTHRWIKIFNDESSLNNSIGLGKAIALHVNGKKICLAKTVNGVFAIADRCPHNGASLSSGFCNLKNEIVCPMHRYPFNLESGRSTSGIAMNVETYPIKIASDGVFLGFKINWWEF